MSKVNGLLLRAVVAAAAVSALSPQAAHAVFVFDGGNGIVSFGVADYGGGPVANPTYILNNFTGLNDVLTSPGHGFLTANTSIVNNIATYGPGPIPGYALQIGGANANGAFGSGEIAMAPSAIGFALTDANPDAAGAASYEIGSWSSQFTNVGAIVGTTYGNVLAVSGHLDTPGAACAVSLRTHVSDSMGVWGGGIDLPQLVLAAAGNLNFQALGGPGGGDAGIFIDANGDFFGLAFNTLGPINIPDNDVIIVTTTLTAIGDPMDMHMLADLSDTPLFLDQLNPVWSHTHDASALLAIQRLANAIFSPEPASLAVLGLGTAGLLLRRRKM